MRMTMVASRLRRALVPVAGALVLFAGHAVAQGSIAGRVSARETGTPLPETRVLVVGTSLVASTGADGRYTLRAVPAGTWDVRVLRVGYEEQKQSVSVTNGGTATADFVMTTAVVKLTEIVTTATGEQRRVELGNSVSTIDVASRAQSAPTTSMATMLVGQAPGVQVMPGNTTGTGARIRIRGVNSLTLANDPIYIIDGVRMTTPTARRAATSSRADRCKAARKTSTPTRSRVSRW